MRLYQNNYISRILILVVITLLVYSNIYKLDFVNWDDHKYVYENTDIHQLSLESISAFFTHPYVGMYQPIPMMTYSIEYHFFQNNPAVYHLTNLFFHFLNILLLFIFIKVLTKNLFIAFFTSFIFAVHPLHVESVAWISERKDVMFAFFYFLSLIYYTYYIDKGNKTKHLVLSLIFFLFSLLSKSAAVTLPIILLLIDYYRSVPISGRKIVQKIPFFTLAVIFGIISIYSQQLIKQELVPTADFSFIDKIFLASGSFTYYLYSFLVPIGLSAFHPFPIKMGDFLPLYFYFSIICPILFVTALILIYKSKKISEGLKRDLLFGLLFFLITLFLYIYIPVGSALVAERYTYLPYIGLGFVIVIIINRIRNLFNFLNKFSVIIFLIKRFKNQFLLLKKIKAAIWIIFICYLGFCAFSSYSRVNVWRNSTTLWTNAVKEKPSLISWYNLGNAYRESKVFPDALIAYHHALDIDSNYADAWNNIGVIYADLKQYNQAIPAFEKANICDPGNQVTLLNRANNYKAMGILDKALSDYNNVIRVDSFNSEAYFQRGTTYIAMGNLVDALIDISKAILLNPRHAEAYSNKGYIEFLLGYFKDAERDIKKAIEIKPNYPEAYNNLFSVMLYQKDLKSARFYVEKAISLNSRDIDAYFNRSILFSQLNKLSAAKNDLDMVIELSPGYYKAYNNRAEIKIRLYDMQGALTDLDRVIQLKPDYGEGYLNRGIVKKKMGQNDQACSDFRKAKQLGVKAADLWIRKNCK